MLGGPGSELPPPQVIRARTGMEEGGSQGPDTHWFCHRQSPSTSSTGLLCGGWVWLQDKPIQD